MASASFEASAWYARIKWYDGKKDTVPISKIRKFSPKTLTDFDKNKWYRVKGSKEYYAYKREHSAYALIGCLAESAEAIEKRAGRVTFSAVEPPLTDPESTASELERLAETSSAEVQSQQKAAADVKKTKLNAHMNSFKQFFNKCAPQPSMQETQDSTENRGDECRQSRTANDNEGMNALKRRVKELEEELELEKKKKKTSSEKDLLLEVEARLKEEMKKCIRSEIKKVNEDVQESFRLCMAEVDTVKIDTSSMKDLLSKSNSVGYYWRIQQCVDAMSDISEKAQDIFESGH